MRLGNAKGRKVLLFLGSADFHSRTWQNGKLSPATHFADNEKGREQFAAFLQRESAPALLLADLIEEDFRFETLPRLRGRERSALIRHRLELHYRDTPFRLASGRKYRDGREQHGNDLTFSALTNPALLYPWLGIMQKQGTPLVGIYSVPHLCNHLIKKPPPACLLLLSMENGAGLRQTYFDAGMLRFSRLTPINDNDSFGTTAAMEVARIRQYLDNLSLLPAESRLDVHIICHASDVHELELQLDNNPSINCHYMDIGEPGLQAGVKTDYTDSDAAPLFLRLLATHPPRNHYASAGYTRFLRLSHIRRALFGLAFATAAASVLLSVVNLMEGIRLEKDAGSIRTQTRQMEMQSLQILHNFSDAPASAADMKAAVLLAREMNMRSPAPHKILAALSETLGSFPGIRLNRLSWKSGAPADGSLHGASMAHAAYTILLDGELTGFTGNYRAALERFEYFRQELLRKGYGVSTLSLPLDISSKASISANTIEQHERPAKFSLKLNAGPAA